jgi:DNA-binding GntR family transcriptional regulator
MRRREAKTGEGRHAALSTSVLRTLNKRIVAWEYPPDYRLVEERLCAEFGVSRSPVREALRVLASNGLLKKPPNRGYAVRQPKVRDSEELCEVRLALELYVVEYLAASGVSAAVTNELRRTWSALLGGRQRKGEELALLDASFHETLARAMDNKMLVAHLRGQRAAAGIPHDRLRNARPRPQRLRTAPANTRAHCRQGPPGRAFRDGTQDQREPQQRALGAQGCARQGVRSGKPARRLNGASPPLREKHRLDDQASGNRPRIAVAGPCCCRAIATGSLGSNG